MEKPEYSKEQCARIDEWLTLCSQSNIEIGTKDYFDLVALMADDDPAVISKVVSTLASSATHH